MSVTPPQTSVGVRAAHPSLAMWGGGRAPLPEGLGALSGSDSRQDSVGRLSGDGVCPRESGETRGGRSSGREPPGRLLHRAAGALPRPDSGGQNSEPESPIHPGGHGLRVHVV